MELDKAIKQRKSVQKFSKKNPNWRDIIKAINMARYAPMAGNLFSLKFIVIKNQKKIQKLAEISQQEFIENAKYIVIVCSNPSRTLNAYGKRGERYIRQQAGAGIQNFLLKLEELNLSTCWVGHFLDKEIKKIIKIPKEIDVEAIFPIGYENEFSKEKRKRKINMDNILYFEKYGNKRMNK